MTRKSKAAQAIVPTIGLEELCQRLIDPDVDEKSLIPYLTAEAPANGMAPILKPNRQTVRVEGDPLRARADLGLGFLNGVYRKRREKLFRRRLKEGDPRPILLAEGDSWFQYPVWLNDIVDCLQTDFTICCLSAAGDTLDNMATRKPEYLKWLKRLTKEEGRTVHAVLISAGGNDLVGDQLAGMIRPFEDDRPPAWYIDNANYLAREARIVEGYRSIFKTVRAEWPQLEIVVHGYDHAIPLPAQGLHVPPLDGWVGKPLRVRGIMEEPLQRSIVRELIDRFNTHIANLAHATPGVTYVDFRSSIGNDWHDELHPNDNGFRRVAAAIRQIL